MSAGSQPLTQYTYNAFGQRLVKIGSLTATTLFNYDGGGRLLEESDGQGNPQVDYIYVGGRPVAEMAPGGKVYFFHDDRLGTPQVATDATQSTAWLANYQPFGATSNSSNLIAQELRLPGQEVDVETGLNHNGFREYIPGWGRYSQSDPIGLSGGPNAYVYVRNGPANSIDPFGLVNLDLLNPSDPNNKYFTGENHSIPGQYTVAVHGVPSADGRFAVGVEDDRSLTGLDANGNPMIYGGNILSPTQLLQLMTDNGYKGGPITLFSCLTGAAGDSFDSFAKQLADLAEATVTAPDNLYWPNNDTVAPALPNLQRLPNGHIDWKEDLSQIHNMTPFKAGPRNRLNLSGPWN